MLRIYTIIFAFIALLPLYATDEVTDSCHLASKTTTPAIDSIDPSYRYGAPHPYIRYGSLDNLYPLHQGLNASLSLSATVGLGGNAPSGVGFGRNMNLVYASPIGKQLTYTLGVNTSNMDWGGFHYNQAGVGGSLNYMLNEKVSFSFEAYKDLVHPQNYMPQQFLHRDQYVGGAVNMKFSENIFFQVSFGSSSWVRP